MIGGKLKRRFGIIKVPLSTLESDPGLVIAIMEGCLILRAECLYAFPGIEYHFAHHSLEPVPECEVPPEYTAEMRGGIRDRFVRRTG